MRPSDAGSQDKLYSIIDSSRLSDGLKNRAKYTVNALDQERQKDLLLDVMLDGVDAYFSREAWDQGAYSLVTGDTKKRLYENMVLPGEGPARRVLAARLGPGVSGRNAATAPAGAMTNAAAGTGAVAGRFLNAGAQRTGNALVQTAAKRPAADMDEVEEKRDRYNNLVWELQALEKTISRISIREKIPFFYSERYQDALAQKQELQSGIARLETELNRLYPRWAEVMDISPAQPAATLQPSAAPTPAPKPTPAPVPTPTPRPTPLPAYMQNAPAPDNAKLAAHWEDFMKELERTVPVDGGLTAEQRFKIIQASAEYIGKYPYGDGQGEVDCSRLVKELYKAVGIRLHGISADIAEMAYSNGWNITKDQLKPGDLIFWDRSGRETKDRWKGISHIGIYLCTDSKGYVWIIDSTGSQGGPSVQKLWSENTRGSLGFKVYGYASLRPQ